MTANDQARSSMLADASRIADASDASEASTVSASHDEDDGVERQERGACPYCGVGCGIVMHVKDKRVIRISGDAAHPTNRGRLCTKGASAHLPLQDSGRLDRAYLRQQRAGDPTPVPMSRAIADTAQRLRAIIDSDGPSAVGFYLSGQMSIEAQYLATKLAKGFIGTPHVEANSRLCMASAASGYKLSLGADGPPGSYDDIDHADLFFVIGANMADCHPILFLRMMDRVKAGAKLIVVDPRKTATADKADLFLRLRPGTDLALLNGLLHLLHREGYTDPAFIAAYTEGWEAMPAFLADYSPAQVAAITGITEADLVCAARWIGEAAEWSSFWTMGLNQSTHGTANTNAVCNLHLATGKICRRGSGPFSLTGQPNAMGGREMGYMGPGLPGQRTLQNADDRAFIESLWQLAPGSLQAPSTLSAAALTSTQAPGGTIDFFQRMASGDIKAAWIICTNPVASVPQRQTVIEGLQRAALVIAQDAFMDTETNRYADVLLPGALWAESDGVMINSERNLTLTQAVVPAPGEAMPDWQIIAHIACAMGHSSAFDYPSAAAVFEEIRRCSNPASGYDLRGASHAALQVGPLQWPCPPMSADAEIDGEHHGEVSRGELADTWLAASLRTEAPAGVATTRHPIRYLNDGISQPVFVSEEGHVPPLAFPTASGKAQFWARPHQEARETPDDAFGMVLNTGRLQHQWHTMTKTGKVGTLNKLNPRPFVELHPVDASALGIAENDPVAVQSRRGQVVLPAVITDRVALGECFAPMHWNDVFGDGLCINAVTHDAVDPISLQPEMKYSAVTLQKASVACSYPPVHTNADTNRVANAAANATSATNAVNDAEPLPVNGLPARTAARDECDSRTSVLSAIAQQCGLPPPSSSEPPAFDADEQRFISGFLAGLQGRLTEGDWPKGAVPVLPPAAPLRAGTRLWIDGLLAGRFGALLEGSVAADDQGSATERPDGVRRQSSTHTGSGLIDGAPLLARPKVTVLWASQTGTVEALVEPFAMRLVEAGCEIRTACMSDITPEAIVGATSSVDAGESRTRYLLLLTSTFGDGDAPDNGQAFWDALQMLSPGSWSNAGDVGFATLAFGNRHYDAFCRHGVRLDAQCEKVGGRRLHSRMDCESDDLAAAEQWLDEVIAAIKRDHADSHATGSPILPTRQQPAMARLVESRRLNDSIPRSNSPTELVSDKDARCIVLSTAGTGIRYEAGDALGVWPTNCSTLVEEVIMLTGADGDALVQLDGQGELALRTALTHHLEIARPHPALLQEIAAQPGNDALARLLEPEQKAALNAWLDGRQFADVLHAYPVVWDAPTLAQMLKRLQPRLYSIASSPLRYPNEVHLTVGTVRYVSATDKVTQRKGIASTFLADRADDVPVPIFVQASPNFRPPRDPHSPMIMVGPGTGIAPFRAFLQQRQARGDTGPNWLFFGERHARSDFYYRDELEQLQRDGVLTRLDTAFSRDQAQKCYVQDRLKEQGAAVWGWLEAGAYFYVCGDASRMAKDVEAALVDVIAAHGGMDMKQANAYLKALARDKRYLRDVY